MPSGRDRQVAHIGKVTFGSASVLRKPSSEPSQIPRILPVANQGFRQRVYAPWLNPGLADGEFNDTVPPWTDGAQGGRGPVPKRGSASCPVGLRVQECRGRPTPHGYCPLGLLPSNPLGYLIPLYLPIWSNYSGNCHGD